MANGIQTTIGGNLTADPELQVLGSGTPKLSFSVAVERSWKNDKGEWENETSFVDCIAWRQLADDAANVLEKGIRVIATGRFEQRFWDDKETGKKRSKWEFVVDDVAVSTKVLESIVRKRKNDGDSRGDSRGGSSSGDRRNAGGSSGAARAASARRSSTSEEDEW
jgi:single-strand DNA-binding protein